MPGRPWETGSAGKSRKWNKYTAETIIDLAKSVKTQLCGFSIFSITVRKDKF